MINKVQFEGINQGVKFRNNQVVKFKLKNDNTKDGEEALITCFKDEYFDIIEHSEGDVLKVNGKFYESSYKDKKTNNWVNTYCITVNSLEVK